MDPFKEKGELPFPQLRRNDPGMVGGKSTPPPKVEVEGLGPEEDLLIPDQGPGSDSGTRQLT